MAKKVLNENEQKIIDEVRDLEFRRQLAEGFQNGEFMTTDEFCQKLEKLKLSLINKYKMMYDNNN